ncbi:MAG: OFA family MFS transporter [Christensenella sp.]|uniref:L-lactate MFS transporter n=1 Tax=Christensenella sp. TaxID=1935934 RepID=UPI002B2188BA|nr:OFA family MFS transporter [Christensenella sp.]MEA5003987.1 OFA family MFS transporter [Christensenella sp.]
MKTTNRLVPLIAAIAIQLCLGIAYLWSIFQTGIANTIFGGNNALASLTFSLLLATLTLGSVAGGKLAEKFSIRAVVITGGIILSAGFFLASFVTPQTPYLLWLTYGIMGGLGMGFSYSTTISCAQMWFPDKKGLVSGLIVSALGFGGVIFTPIIENLIKSFGGVEVGELKTFMVLSIIFLVVCTVGGLFLKMPPKDYALAGQKKVAAAPVTNLSPKQVLKNRRFYLITFTMMFACMGGLMMIGFAKPIATAKGLAETATIGVLVISVCNSMGRLFWGTISDKIGRRLTMFIILTGAGVASLCVGFAAGYWVYAIIGIIGFFYGGILGTFPALTADLFGPKNMATNYGLVLLGFGAGAIISSYIAGYFKDIAAQDINLMTPAFLIAAAGAFLGLILMAFALKKSPDQKKA